MRKAGIACLLSACAVACWLAGAWAVPRLPREQAARRTAEMLAAVPWTSSLDDACKRAARDGRLVFWMHMLGRLDGFT